MTSVRFDRGLLVTRRGQDRRHAPGVYMPLIDFLRASYLFRDMDESDLRWLSDIARPRVLNAGEVLFQEGGVANSLVMIKSGSVDVQKEAVNGTQSLATLGPGSMLGEMAYVERETRSASVIARERLEVVEIFYEDFDTRMSKDDSFGGKIYHAVARALIKTVRRTTNDLTALRELKLRGRE